jgi:hypothetical protein
VVWTVPTQVPRTPLRGVLGREAAQQMAVVVDTNLQYLQAQQAQIQYAAFRAVPYPIGSGSVESANKLLVDARLKGAEMRWAPASVNPMVAQQHAQQTRTAQRRAARRHLRTRLADDQAHAAAATTSPPPIPPRPHGP